MSILKWIWGKTCTKEERRNLDSLEQARQKLKDTQSSAELVYLSSLCLADASDNTNGQITVTLTLETRSKTPQNRGRYRIVCTKIEDSDGNPIDFQPGESKVSADLVLDENGDAQLENCKMSADLKN